MVRLDSMEDGRNGVVTYELRGGLRVRLNADAVRKYGAGELIRSMGHGALLPTERMAVIFDGRDVGTLPPDFDPTNIKSQSVFYDPRPGDFRREGDTWVAGRTLGPGDLESVEGFIKWRSGHTDMT